MELCDYFKIHLASDIVSTLHCQHNKLRDHSLLPDHSLLEFKFHIDDMVYHDINGEDPLATQTNISQTERHENEQSVNFHEVKDLTLCQKKYRALPKLGYHINFAIGKWSRLQLSTANL